MNIWKSLSFRIVEKMNRIAFMVSIFSFQSRYLHYNIRYIRRVFHLVRSVYFLSNSVCGIILNYMEWIYYGDIFKRILFSWICRTCILIMCQNFYLDVHGYWFSINISSLKLNVSEMSLSFLSKFIRLKNYKCNKL